LPKEELKKTLRWFVVSFLNVVRWLGVALAALLIAAGGAACAAPAPAVSPSPTAAPALPCAEDGSVQSDSADGARPGSPIRFEIYLPPCYEQRPSLSYPVLYLLHGASGGSFTWNQNGAAQVANRMIRGGEVPPFILVTPGFASDVSASLDSICATLADGLVPQIDRRFRTLADRQHRAVAGASFGGVVATYMAFQFPAKFGSVGAFGAGILDQQAEGFNRWVAATPPDQRPRVLIDVGDRDTAMLPFTHVLTQTLTQQNIPYTLIVKPGDHSYQYWASHLETYYRWFAEDW
jgi:enterochelin esterase-like enzyme